MNKIVYSIQHKEKFNSSLIKHKEKLSKSLWRPITEQCDKNTDRQPHKMLSNSWFSFEKKNFSNANKNLAIHQLKLEPESKPKKTSKLKLPIRVKTFQLNLSKNLQSKFKEAINVTRFLYNECVRISKEDPAIGLDKLRSLLTTNSSVENILDEKLRKEFERVPNNVRDEALRDFHKAYKIQKKLVKEGKITHFEMKFRSKKNKLQESIVLHHAKMKRDQNGGIKIYPTFWDKEIICPHNEKFPDIINHDCRLIMRKSGKLCKFFLAIPIDVIGGKVKKLNAVSLDPGIKIFQTTYDTEGNSYLIGENDVNKLDSLNKIATKMREGKRRVKKNNGDGSITISFEQATNKKQRKSLKKAANNIENKVRNKVKEIHLKTVKFLCDNYDTVIIPEFKTSRMVKKMNDDGKWNRNVNKETARKMLRWGHFKFRELLKAKGEATGTRIIVGTEEWTSKTCGNCFCINHDLNLHDREFICKECGCHFHRDINAARNIMMLNWEKAKLQTFHRNQIGRPISIRVLNCSDI
jgi:putative transposase